MPSPPPPGSPAAPIAPAIKGTDFYLHEIRAYWASWIDWVSTNALQIAVAVMIGAVIVAAQLGIRWLALRFCRVNHGVARWPTVVARALVRTSIWFMVAVAAKLVQGYAQTPPAVASTIYFFFTVAVVLQAAVWTRELILGLVEYRAGGPDEHSSLASALGLIRVLVTITLFAIATLMILDNLGVNVTGLIAGLGIGGIAIGLAAKGIFDDLFSALSIIFDRPFRRGDTISWDKSTGTVEAIGLKTTRVRAVTGEEIVISNTNILAKQVHNLARLDRRRIILPVGLTYDTPPDVCAALPEIVKAVVEAVPKCTLNRFGMTGFGDSSLDFELQFDVHSEDLKEVAQLRSQVCIALLRAFNDRGVEFAFPTQVNIGPAAPGPALTANEAQGPPPRPPAPEPG